MTLGITYSRLPEHMRDTAQLYVEHGIAGGSFFSAVVAHDLMQAFMKADDINAEAMRDWAMWLYNDAPCGCHGSPEIVARWIKDGGMLGGGAS